MALVRRGRISLLGCLVIVAFTFVGMREVKAAPDEYQVKSALIYNLLNFAEWKKDIGSMRRFCVIGSDDPIYNNLKAISNAKKSKYTVEIVEKGRDSPIDNCHFLIVSTHYRNYVDHMIGRSDGLAILTISDTKKFTKRGGIVSIYIDRGSVKMGANITKMREAGITIDSELLEIMDIVK